MPSIAIYGRASLDRTERRISVDRQVARCQDLAAATWPDRVPLVLVDNNLSGSNPDVVRPAWNQLLAGIRSGDIEHVVAHEQSRFTRQPAQWDEFVVALTRAGIDRVHTVTQGVVPVNPGNRLLGRILAVVDADESERTRMRALAMHEQIAGEGRPGGGQYYGYRREWGRDGRSQLVIDADEAKVVRYIVDQLAAGQTGAWIADRLTADGVPTGRDGRRWWSTTVLGIARRPHVAGLRLHHDKTGPGRWEPIVQRDRWDRVQHIIGSPGGRPSRPRRHLLTGGIARCGLCGEPITTAQQKRPEGYVCSYACNKRPRVPEACGKISLGPVPIVEAVVARAVLARLRGPGAGRLTVVDDQPERAQLRERQGAAEARIARAAELYGAGELDELAWRQVNQTARSSADAARRQLDALPGAQVDLPGVEAVVEGWDGLLLEQRRAVLSRMVEHVVILPRTARRPADPYERVTERLDVVWR